MSSLGGPTLKKNLKLWRLTVYEGPRNLVRVVLAFPYHARAKNTNYPRVRCWSAILSLHVVGPLPGVGQVWRVGEVEVGGGQHVSQHPETKEFNMQSKQYTQNFYPPASKASREEANLTERKNTHTPRIWCQRICLSVTNFDPKYLRINRTNNHLKKSLLLWLPELFL